MIKKSLFIIAIMGALSFSFIYYNVYFLTYNGEDMTFTIDHGDSFGSINHKLHRMGIIHSPSFLHRYCKLKNYITRFKSGTFLIPSGSNLVDVVNILVFGQSITIPITIPEGKNIFEIGKILSHEDIVDYDEFIKLATDPHFAKSLNIPFERVEGFLFPNTYKFDPKSKAEFVIKTMVDEFFKKTADLNFSDTYLSPHQVITLASIVEKETGAKFERPIISGVFHNRLKKKMRLQSDPTTIYGIFERYQGNLKKIDLETKTDYNTYKIEALPKGPICNPGLEAIKATLYPEKHRFLYFVSQNDGTHLFSENYKDHSKGVEIFQKNRKNRKGKSWRNLKDQ